MPTLSWTPLPYQQEVSELNSNTWASYEISHQNAYPSFTSRLKPKGAHKFFAKFPSLTHFHLKLIAHPNLCLLFYFFQYAIDLLQLISMALSKKLSNNLTTFIIFLFSHLIEMAISFTYWNIVCTFLKGISFQFLLPSLHLLPWN